MIKFFQNFFVFILIVGWIFSGWPPIFQNFGISSKIEEAQAVAPILTQDYYRFYVDNDALDPTDPWPAGATDLGENATITSGDEPPASGEKLRIRMSIAVSVDSMPASSQDFKLQFGTLITTCAAIASWTDLGNPGSAAIWRGFNGTPADNTNLSIDPPTAGDLNLSVSDRAGTYEEQNNTAFNPFAVATGEDVEYDWAIEDNGATGEATYCFRMIKSGGTALDGYNFYPTLITSGYRPKSQNWQWFNDETNETPISSLAGENVAPSNIVNGNIIKLRFTIDETAGVAGTDIKFKIQFSEHSDFSQGVIDAVEIGLCAGNSLWCYGDGVDTDDDAITTLVLTDSSVAGRHNESGISASTFDPAASTSTEFEFTIKLDGTRANATYFFRAFDVTNNLAVPLDTGETYPSLSTEGATLTFTIGGISSGTTTEGITTDVTTTPTTIPYGTLTFDLQTEAAQSLTVSTNATEGYQVFMFQRQGFLNTAYGGVEIDQVTGTNASPGSWSTVCPVGTDGCYGYHAGDDALSGGSTRFSPNDTYARFTTTAEEVAFSSIPMASEVTDIIFKAQISNQQEAGNYNSSVVYIVIPTF